MVRRLLKNIGFTLVIWTVLFLLAEGTLRLYAALFEKRSAEWTDGQLFMCEPDAVRIWHYKKDYQQVYRSPEFTMHVRTNDGRLRGGPRPVAPPPDADGPRILVLGDSFTFGWGVEDDERYSEVLEGLLNEDGAPHRVAVLNAGYWAYTFDQQYLLLKELLPRWRPRLVLQGLYAPHVITLLSHRWGRSPGGELVAVHNDGIRVAPDGSLHFTNDYLERPPFSSRLVAWVFRVWFNWRLSREAMTGDLALMDPAVRRYDLAWDMAADVLARTAAYLRGEGVGYVAFGIPRDLQVSDEEWNDTYRKSVEGHALDRDLPSRRLGEAVRQAGGEWFDLRPGFRQRYRPRLYYDLDPHWTKEGHRLAGELLLPSVQARLAASH